MAYCSSYYLYQRYEKRGDQDWIPSYPNVYSIDGEGSKPLRARQMYDTDCGWIPDTEPIYRWINVTPSSDPSTYVCDDCSSLYANQPFTVVAHNEDTEFQLNAGPDDPFDVYYSSDGVNWTHIYTDDIFIPIPAGTKKYFKVNSSFSGRTWFYIGNGDFDVEGNIMSLGNLNFESATTIPSSNYYAGLFSGNTHLISAENLVLPATRLTEHCYANMFRGCTSLTSAPSVLPAMIATDNCYDCMFFDCTSLTSAPELPATTVGAECYFGMFGRCRSLTTAPSILPATNLNGATYCYSQMFNGCSGLTTAPELPATTLSNGCYEWMFRNCSSLNYIKCLATNISANDCTYGWVDGVASSGTFVKASNMSSWTRGVDGIPSGWTIQNA